MIYCFHCLLSKVLDSQNTVEKKGALVPSGNLQPSGGDKNQTNKHRSKQNANCIVSKDKRIKINTRVTQRKLLYVDGLGVACL